MHVVVVGGTGLIGKYVVSELRRLGHVVRVLARSLPPDGLLPDDVEFVQGDLLKDSLDRALSGMEGVIHTAGADFRTMPGKPALDFYRKVNVEGSVRLFQAAIDAGVKQAVFVTTYYGGKVPREFLQKHPYIRSRVESEEKILELCRGRLRVSIIQPTYVIGHIEGRWSLPTSLAKYVRSRLPLFAPSGGTNFIAAASLGEAIVTALEKGENGKRYVVGDENISWRNLIERLTGIAGGDRHIFKTPRLFLKSLAGCISLYGNIKGLEPGVNPRAWADIVTNYLYVDCRDAQTVLGYTTGNLNDAIEESVVGVAHT